MPEPCYSLAVDDTRPPKLEVYRDKNVALEYDRRWSGSLGAKRDKRKASAITKAFKLLSKHHAIQFQSVLDIPCGTGRFSNLLDQFGCKTTGADLSDEMLEQARLKHPQHEYLTADMATIPFADDTFTSCAFTGFARQILNGAAAGLQIRRDYRLPPFAYRAHFLAKDALPPWCLR